MSFDVSIESIAEYEELTAENAKLNSEVAVQAVLIRKLYADVAALKEQVAVLLDELSRAVSRLERDGETQP